MAGTQTQPKESRSTVDTKASGKDPGFQALGLPKSTETAQTLKASEGNRLTEPFRVARALAGRVFQAAYAMYDNARTDIRVANAVKQMEKFNPAQITAGASADTILKTWSEMAKQNSHVESHMKSLGGAAGKIVGASRNKLEQLRSDITSILERPVKEGTALQDCVGESGASHIKSLTTEEKKAFVAAYGELRGKLSDLNSLSRKVEDQAKAFYESSVERFQAQDSFKPSPELGAEAMAFYRKGLGTVHKKHVEALEALAAKDAKPDEIREVGKEFTAKIKELNEKTAALSASLKQAATIEGKVTETLKYLTHGVGGSTAVGRPDKSVVFVSAAAADKIADWVRTQTAAERDELAKAKQANDPAAIAKATEKLEAASKVVHKQLDDVAALLSELNAGRDAANKGTDGVLERIIAKAGKYNVSIDSFSGSLKEYIEAINEKTDSIVADIFKDRSSKTVGTGELKKFVGSHKDRVEYLLERDASDGLDEREVKKALRIAQDALTEKPAPTKDKVDLAAEKFERQLAQRLAEMDKQPKQSVFSRLRSWFINN
ncbi:MAG: hypothetical protein RL326_295 [Pseudomonadota bacterium]|jgi:hypothetical protein